jgi:DNA-binding NtrC family response regulator
MSGHKTESLDTIRMTTAEAEALLRRRVPKSRAVLLVYHRDGVETVRLEPGDEIVVGREPPADIVIPDGSLSRRHARFVASREEIIVEDLGSTNGTRLERRRITREAIKPGDELRLGAIVVAVHAVASDEAPFLDLNGHDAFHAALEAELMRARFFGRSCALITARTLASKDGHLRRWSPRVRGLLRVVDRIGLYSSDTLEILLPEITPEKAVALAEAIVAGPAGEPRLACGVACFPGAASSAEALLEHSRRAALAASVDAPVRVAPSEGARPATPDDGDGDGALVAKSPRLKAVTELARRAARSVVPVLLQGETGTGKEVLARFIHDAGPRRDKPMICVNCGAIPAQLVESTLFGHERGAFTGAVQQQQGVFEAADGGSVLLDEIGELPAAAQAALLRVLETKRLSRVGSTKEIEVDVRILAATHRDLEAMAIAGSFRADLYYRLGVMTLEIPPLRHRREDIPALAARFLGQAALANGCPVSSIAPEAMAMLERYSWPGNVRELRNVIERAVVIAEGDTITVSELSERLRAAAGAPVPASVASVAPPPARGSNPPLPEDADGWTGGLRAQLDRFEAALLLKALQSAGGSQVEAARLLDLPLRTLQHRLKAHGIRKGYDSTAGK